MNKTGTANGTVSVSGSGLTRTVTISSIYGDGSLGISIAARHRLGPGGQLGPSPPAQRDLHGGQHPAGHLISAPSTSYAAGGPVTYTVTYVDANFNTSSLAWGNVTLNKNGNVNGAVSVSGSGVTRTVTISGIYGNGSLTISIAAGTASDLAGNLAPATGPSTPIIVDNTPPTISVSAPSASSTPGQPVTYTVTYADANFNTSTLSPADITLNKTGTANGAASVSGTGSTQTVTISNITGVGSLGISIAADTASDLAGNLAPAPDPSSTFGVNVSYVMTAAAANWTDGGLTLTLENDGLLHLLHSDTGLDAVSAQIPADVASVNITGRDNAADALTIDFSHGNPIPSGGVAFDGGQGGNADSLSTLDAGASDSAVLSATKLTVHGSSVINYQDVPDLSFALGPGTLDLGGSIQTVAAFTLVSGQLVNGTLSSNAFTLESGTVAASLTGPGGLTKTGSGTVTLSAVNTYYGPTIINGGTLQVSNSAGLGGTGSVAISAGTLEASASTTSPSAYTLSDPASTIEVDPSQTLTLTGSIAGTGTLNVTGGGTLILPAADSYAGGTVAAQGIVQTSGPASLGTGTVAMTGGTLSLQSPASPTQTYPNNIVVTAGSTINVKNEPAVMGPLFIGSNTLAVTGATGMGLTVGTTFFLAGNPTFAPASGITLTLGGFNDAGTARTVTVSGQGIVTAAGPAVGVVAPITLDVTGGTFNVNNATSLGTHANVVLSNGAILGLGANQTFATLGGTGTVNLNGHLLTAGGYDMKLAGASPGQYDELNVTGKPTLTGASLNLSYVNNFLPSLGESFTIIQTTGGVNGQFTQGNTITAGMVTYSINYAGNGGNAVVLTVASMAATHFVVNAAPSPVAPGGSVTVTVTAEDANNHQTAAYSGPFTLSSSDRLFTPLTHLSLTNGSGTFTETLETLGSQTFTVTDNEATNPLPAATSNPVTVALVATHFLVQASPATVTAGTPLLYSVTAVSAGGQTVTGYSGTVTLTTSDVGAPFISQGTLLPTSATISGGVGYFLAVLDRVGSGTQTITATDSVNNLTGTGTFTVTPAATSQFVVSGAPAGTLTGSPFSLTVTAEDAYGNLTPAYHGTVSFSSSDALAVRNGNLPANYTFTTGAGGDNGVHAFTNEVTLLTPGAGRDGSQRRQ